MSLRRQLMRLVVINHLTLDGVMQGPGRPDEDTRNAFSHGGWAIAGGDEVMGRVLGARMGRPDGGLLLGRRTYEEMLGFWNGEGGPFKDTLNSAPKYVVSRNPAAKLDWPHSSLLQGDVPAAVLELKKRLTGDLVMMGSGQLIRSLLPRNLIDEYLLFIHPLVLGSGQRLFEHETPPVELRLTESTATTTGVLIATYEPDR
jgi:dihydrofolate reductase